MKKWFSTSMPAAVSARNGFLDKKMTRQEATFVLLWLDDEIFAYWCKKFNLTFRGRFDISFRVTVKDDLLVSFHQRDVVDLHPGLAASTCRGHQGRVPSRWGQISAAIITAVTFAVIFAVFFNFDLDADTLLALNWALGTSHLHRRKSAKGKHSSLFNET